MSITAEEILSRAVDESDKVIKSIMEILETIYKLSLHYAEQIKGLYMEFGEDLLKNSVDLDSYLKNIEEIEKEVRIDAAYLEKIISDKMRGLVGGFQATGEPLIPNPAALVERMGCRMERGDVVLLGIAVEYAVGGQIRESLCALLASVAAERGRWDIAGEIGRRCLNTDLEAVVKLTCGIAKIVEKYRLDDLGGLSDVLEEIRKY